MIFDGETIKLEALGDGFFELRFDRKSGSVNKFDRQPFAELTAATRALAATAGLKGVLVTSAKDHFIVGADIFEFAEVFESGEGATAAFVAGNAAVLSEFGRLDAPSVVAIGGLALGGGLELALACDQRVAARGAKIGLPEVTLGIFPGYGGTARLPRLVGLTEAARWIVSGAPQPVEKAFEVGAVDAVVEPEALRAAALERLKAIAAGGEWRKRREDGKKSLGLPVETVVEQLSGAKVEAARALPHYPAAAEAVRTLEDAAALTLDEALALEAKRFAAVALTQAAYSLVGNFVNDQAIKKIVKTYARAAAPVRKSAVLGAGVMGAGVAYQSALKGVPAILKDVSAAALEKGRAYAESLLDKQVERGRMKKEKAEAVLAAITPTESFEGFSDVDVVVEAVLEEIRIKEAVFAQVEASTGPGALIVSNTSSLRIKDLSAGVSRPQNFLGMHFFNPVPAMALVEVIRGPQTSDAALATIVNFAATLGKTPIVVGDCPGFVVNRVLTPYLIAFLELLREGVDFREIDRAMQAFGWPMGPAYLADVIGLDITQHVIEIVSEGFSERMDYPKPGAVELLKADGRLGQKNGRGFYIYAKDAKGRPSKEADPAVLDLLRQNRSGEARLDDAEICERMMLPMVFEAARCLEDGTAASPAEVDMCLILGLGLPRYLGGALRYADWLGADKLLAAAKKWESVGPIYRAGEGLRQLAARGGRFYG